MRLILWMSSVLLAAGCTNNESTEERLADFSERAKTICARYFITAYSCKEEHDVPADQAAACMNDALTTGIVARVSFDTYIMASPDPGPYTDVFTTDHHVVVFHGEFDYHRSEWSVSEQTCAGPFHVTEICPATGSAFEMVAWDGCP